MENGSGGFISDLVFDGGMYALWVGNQQFTSRNITIRDASIAGVYLNWDWGWTFKSLDIQNTPVGVDVVSIATLYFSVPPSRHVVVLLSATFSFCLGF